MKLRLVLVPLIVATVGVVGIQGTASSAPLTKQNFTLTSDNIEGPGGTVVASGAINATGEDVAISDTEDQFVFPDGTLTIVHAPCEARKTSTPTPAPAPSARPGTTSSARARASTKASPAAAPTGSSDKPMAVVALRRAASPSRLGVPSTFPTHSPRPSRLLAIAQRVRRVCSRLGHVNRSISSCRSGPSGLEDPIEHVQHRPELTPRRRQPLERGEGLGPLPLHPPMVLEDPADHILRERARPRHRPGFDQPDSRPAAPRQ